MQAVRVIEDARGIHPEVVERPVPEPGPGQVLIRAEWSSVNYKDALAATRAGRIMKRLPLTAGVDVAGSVAASADPRWREGDGVLVTGYGLGVEVDGGFAEYVLVPGDWVVPVPEGLSGFQAMALGTAGFTAGLALLRLEHMGLKPGAGPVAVTGASGGLGSLSVDMLAGRGYEVAAISGKAERGDYLRELGAARVLDRRALELGEKPLEKAQWAGAVDTVGGKLLAWLTRTMAYRGVIAACGLAGGIELDTTVLPFILRGISLMGIESVACPMEERLEVWRRLATDLRPRHLESGIARTVALEELPGAFQGFLDGTVTGRIVVDIQ
jgi:acrylyl-CoA reductase (NADPH)